MELCLSQEQTKAFMNSRHQVRLYRRGLHEVTENLRGDERIYSGLRPSDYHPGNSIVLAVYPHLLARSVAANGRRVRFDYVITLNDLEPLDYDLRALRPRGPSMAFTTRVESVIALVENDLKHLSDEFPECRIRFIPTSSLVDTEVFQKTIEILTQNKIECFGRFLHPGYLARRDIESMEFAGRVCGECRATIKMTDSPSPCAACGAAFAGNSDYYWMHYVPLIAMKLRVLQPDVVILGSDYIEPVAGSLMGMIHNNSLEAILDFYELLPAGRSLQFLMPPLLLGKNQQKMSKSLGNLAEVSYEHILGACARMDESHIPL